MSRVMDVTRMAAGTRDLKNDYPYRMEDEAWLNSIRAPGSSSWGGLSGASYLTWCIREGGVRYYRAGSAIDIEYVPQDSDVDEGWYLIDSGAPGREVVYDVGPFESLERAATALMHLLEMHPETIGG